MPSLAFSFFLCTSAGLGNVPAADVIESRHPMNTL